MTLAIDAGDDDVRIGSTAQAAVSLTAAKDVLTVPTSAVAVSGSAATVLVLRDGRAEPVSVQIGAMGSALTEITKGLTAGDQVVLADLSKPITTGSSSSGSLGG